MFTSIFLALFAAASGVLSTPSLKISQCDVSHVTLNVPSGLAAPIAGGPKFIGIAIGVQNYTCAASGTFTSVGAVAEIFDVSCLPPSHFDALTDKAIKAWEAAPPGVTTQEVIKGIAELNNVGVLGQHFFITNPITGSSLSPKWDFTSASLKGHPDAFVVGARTGGIPAPTDPATNVDWLSLNKVQGNLADQIFRVQTRNGQPPASCTPGSKDISVKYASQYWFFGGSF